MQPRSQNVRHLFSRQSSKSPAIDAEAHRRRAMIFHSHSWGLISCFSHTYPGNLLRDILSELHLWPFFGSEQRQKDLWKSRGSAVSAAAAPARESGSAYLALAALELASKLGGI